MKIILGWSPCSNMSECNSSSSLDALLINSNRSISVPTSKRWSFWVFNIIKIFPVSRYLQTRRWEIIHFIRSHRVAHSLQFLFIMPHVHSLGFRHPLYFPERYDLHLANKFILGEPVKPWTIKFNLWHMHILGIYLVRCHQYCCPGLFYAFTGAFLCIVCMV